MPKALGWKEIALVIAVSAVGFFIGGALAHADVIQSDNSVPDTTQGNSWQLNIGQNWSGIMTAPTLYFGADIVSGTTNVQLDLLQYSDPTYTTLVAQCDWKLSTSAGVYATTTYQLPTNNFNSGIGCTVATSSYLAVLVSGGAVGADQTTVFGAFLPPPWITVSATPGGTVAVPYFVLPGVFGNGQAINWQTITPAPPFTLGTTSQAIAASSSLWASITIASSTISCDSGNVFSDGLCSAFAYLFVPAPSVLQQAAGLPAVFGSRFPFSWVYGIQSVFAGFQASSTVNTYTAQIDLADLPLNSASTSIGNVLPNYTAFSTTTITQLMPAGMWDTIQLLLKASLWISLGLFIFYDTKKEMHRV